MEGSNPRPVKHLFLSTLTAECANHLKHWPHFRELKHNECQYHYIYRADIKSVSFKGAHADIIASESADAALGPAGSSTKGFCIHS